jgi:quinol monooxygenase YgiN
VLWIRLWNAVRALEIRTDGAPRPARPTTVNRPKLLIRHDKTRTPSSRTDVERAVLWRRDMVRLNVVLSPGSSRGVDDLLDALRFIIAGTRLEPGCRGCSVWADPDMTVHYVESWASEMELRQHVRSPLFTSLLAIIESLRLPPQLQFDFVSTSRGLDYIAEVRRDPSSESG